MDQSCYKNDVMAQNKLKLKVEMLTKTVKQLIEDFIKLDSMTRGTLTAFQMYIGKDEWEKIVEQLKEKEKLDNELE